MKRKKKKKTVPELGLCTLGEAPRATQLWRASDNIFRPMSSCQQNGADRMASLQSQGGRGGSTVGSFCQGRWLPSLVNGQQLSQGTLSLGQGLWKYIDLLHLYTAVILWDERGAIKAHTTLSSLGP